MLRHLGIEVDGRLPAVSRCAVCRQVTLTTYQDTTCGGQWHVCSHCGLAGDNLELAAAAMQLPLDDVADALVSAGVLTTTHLSPALMTASLDAYARRQHRAKELWNNAGSIIGVGSHVAQAAGSRMADSTSWDSRGGLLLRRIDRETAETFFGLQNAIWTPAKPPRDWHTAGIIPFEDLPGRISAFLLAVEVGTGSLAWNYQSVYGSICPEGFTPSMVVSKTAGPLVVSTNPIDALRHHVKNMEETSESLPLIAVWPEAKTPECLRLLNRRLIIAGEPSQDFFRIASELDAHAAILEDSYRYRFQPAEFCQVMIQRARPWREALKIKLADFDSGRAQAFLSGLNMTEDGEKAERAQPGQSVKIAVVDGVRIVEDEDGWRLPSNELLSDVVIRIDTALAHKETGRLWYQGVVRFRRVELPFTATREKFEANPFRFAQQVVVESGLGVPSVKSRWRSKAMELALAFHAPATEIAREPGWNEAAQAFFFPTYKVDAHGVVTEHVMPNISEHAAAKKIGMPVMLTREEIDEVRNWNDGFWQIFLTVAYNLLAPLYGFAHRGLLACDNFGLVEESAESLGCPTAEPPRGEQRAAQIEKPGGWPVAIKGPIRIFTAWSRWLRTPRNFIVGVDPLEAHILAANGDWFFLRDPIQVEPRGDRLLADFLHFAVSHLRRGLWGDDPMQRVRVTFADYLESRGAPVIFPVDRLTKTMVEDRTPELFGYVAACLTTRGYIKAPNNRAGIRLDVMQINKALADRAMPVFEIEKLAEKMQGVISERNSQVWLVPNSWWEQQLAAWKTGRRSTLRLRKEVG